MKISKSILFEIKHINYRKRYNASVVNEQPVKKNEPSLQKDECRRGRAKHQPKTRSLNLRQDC